MMPNYQKMYTELFNKITDIITDLQHVQCDAENVYIDSFSALTEVIEFPRDKKSSAFKSKTEL